MTDTAHDVKSRPDILSLFPEEVTAFVRTLGEKDFRGKQLYEWMQKGASFAEMTNLPKTFKEKLADATEYRLPKIEEKLVSKQDGTVKYLFSLLDGECVESVFMRYEHGNTLCISSQAGCRMGCKFCASTLRGKVRDLTPSEMLGQIILAQKDTGERIGGVVMMGIGEPLDNYENTVRFLKLVSHPAGLNIGLRHISLSTCGIVPQIMRLAKENLPITLSISLHASDNETRDALMPINRKYPIEPLLAACRNYFAETGRRVSFEYTLISGKNDSLATADALAVLLKKGMQAPCHVNLILLNEVKETGLLTVAKRSAEAFRDQLLKRGVNATIRRRLGGDIEASCGQLRLRHSETNGQNTANS